PIPRSSFCPMSRTPFPNATGTPWASSRTPAQSAMAGCTSSMEKRCPGTDIAPRPPCVSSATYSPPRPHEHGPVARLDESDNGEIAALQGIDPLARGFRTKDIGAAASAGLGVLGIHIGRTEHRRL